MVVPLIVILPPLITPPPHCRARARRSGCTSRASTPRRCARCKLAGGRCRQRGRTGHLPKTDGEDEATNSNGVEKEEKEEKEEEEESLQTAAKKKQRTAADGGRAEDDEAKRVAVALGLLVDYGIVGQAMLDPFIP